MTQRFLMKSRGHLRVANHAGAIGENRSRARLVPCRRLTAQLVADRIGDSWVGSFKRHRRAIFSLDHLDGGGALSGGSR